jgi:DNA modification methylase
MDNKELHMHNSKILEGNLLDILPTLPDNHFDAVLCDPPYHLTQNSRGGSARKCSRQLGDGGTTPYGRRRVGTDTSTGTGFMGQTWDGGDIAFQRETWAEVMRVMKPGGYLLAFGGSRTFHRMAVALEDAGFVLVDTLIWLYGSGMPKSRNIAADIDRLCGGSGQRTGPARRNTYDGAQRNPSQHGNPADQSHIGDFGLHSTPHGLPTVALETPEGKQWDGYGTALKPAFEPVLLCRKPGEKTYAENALEWGCGALNIDGARIPVGDSEPNGRPLREIRPDPQKNGNVYAGRQNAGGGFDGGSRAIGETSEGRWPANVLLDEEAARLLDAQSGIRKSGAMRAGTLRGIGNLHVYGKAAGAATVRDIPPSAGGASRFFYVSKVSTKERQAGVAHGNHHPTLKPIDLARQLATLLLPPARHDGVPRKLLVPFSGAGSEMIGGLLAGWDEVIGIEQSPEYAEIAQKRIKWWTNNRDQNS